MFEINRYIINKMGWVEYSMSRGVGINYQSHSINKSIVQPFADDPLVRFFIDIKDQYICYIIKEFSKEEKQKTENLYKFIRMEYSPETLNEREGNPKFIVKGFKSNTELFGFIVKYKACSNEYQRHFKLNSILNEKN